MNRMIRVVLPCVLIALCVTPAFGSVLMRYCDSVDWKNKQCTGNCYFSYQDVPGGNETAWTWGPRGQKETYCAEWWGQVTVPAGQCIIADADDGAQVFINNNLVVDKWNSYDPRGCPKKKGCPANSGKLYIIYYNDYGESHFSLKTGACGAAESSFTPLAAAAFTGTPAIPTGVAGQKLEKLTTTTCCYESLQDCGAKPLCKDVLQPVEIASISKSSEVWRSTFWTGQGEYSIVGPYILPCTQSLFVGTNGSNAEFANSDNVVLKVTIGSVVDYYKPLPGYNLCDMLSSNSKHLWSKSGRPFTFLQPRYHYSDNTIGGSDNDWPKQFIPGDSRNYLNFWGGNGANGACCHDSVTSNAQWNREAVLEVVPVLPGLTKPTLNNSLPSWTKPVNTWLPFAWTHGDWQMEYQQYYPLTENGVLNDWTGVNGDVYYHRACGVYNQTGAGGLSAPNKFIFAICMGKTFDDIKGCNGTVDYFRAATGTTYNFCDVLRSKNLYEWAYDAKDPNPANWKWTRPEPYYHHYGGSRDQWPVNFCKGTCQGVYQTAETCGYDPACYWKADWNSCLNNPNVTIPQRCTETRQFLPFWGGHYGGHGYADLTAPQGTPENSPQWRRSYAIRLAKIDTTK